MMMLMMMTIVMWWWWWRWLWCPEPRWARHSCGLTTSNKATPAIILAELISGSKWSDMGVWHLLEIWIGRGNVFYLKDCNPKKLLTQELPNSNNYSEPPGFIFISNKKGFEKLLVTFNNLSLFSLRVFHDRWWSVLQNPRCWVTMEQKWWAASVRIIQ